MAAFMKPFEDYAYAALRIVAGLLFLWHGTQKLFDYPVAAPEMPAAVSYVAGGIELAGGLLVAIGFQTRWAAFLCSGLMAVAYWMVHGLNHVLPMMNRGELAVIYCFVFLFISTRGGGKWSLDSAI